MDALSLALARAFARWPAYVVSLVGAAGMFLVLVWSGESLKHYDSGWELHIERSRFVAVVILALLFGLLLPLQFAVLAKARAVGGAVGGAAGTLFGLLSMSCCAPFVVPTILSFVGFSGTAILSFNGLVVGFTTQLMLLSILCLLVSIALVSRTLAAACRIDGQQLPKRTQDQPS